MKEPNWPSDPILPARDPVVWEVKTPTLPSPASGCVRSPLPRWYNVCVSVCDWMVVARLASQISVSHDLALALSLDVPAVVTHGTADVFRHFFM